MDEATKPNPCQKQTKPGSIKFSPILINSIQLSSPQRNYFPFRPAQPISIQFKPIQSNSVNFSYPVQLSPIQPNSIQFNQAKSDSLQRSPIQSSPAQLSSSNRYSVQLSPTQLDSIHVNLTPLSFRYATYTRICFYQTPDRPAVGCYGKIIRLYDYVLKHDDLVIR